MSGGPVADGLRRIFVKRFPYYILYAVDESQILVIAVAHFRQRPGYWRQRTAR